MGFKENPSDSSYRNFVNLFCYSLYGDSSITKVTGVLALPNKITVSRENYTLDYSEPDFLDKLRDIETLGFLDIRYLTGHRDTLKTYIEIIPKPELLLYFENKRAQKYKRKLEFWKWMIPVIISSLSLLWNIFNTLYSTHLKELIDSLISSAN